MRTNLYTRLAPYKAEGNEAVLRRALVQPSNPDQGQIMITMDLPESFVFQD